MDIQQQHKLVKLGVVVAVVIIAVTMLMDGTLDPAASRSQGEDATFRSMIVPTEQGSLAATDLVQRTPQTVQPATKQPEIKVVATKPAELDIIEVNKPSPAAEQPKAKVMAIELAESDVIAAEKNRPVKEHVEPEIAAVMAELASHAEQGTTAIPAERQATPKLEELESAAIQKSAIGIREVITPKLGKKKQVKLPAVSGSLSDKAWVVQLGSFGNTKNAIRLRNKLRKKGFMAFVENVTINDKRSTRVYIGPLLDFSQAEESLERLEKDFKMKGLIVEYGGL